SGTGGDHGVDQRARRAAPAMRRDHAGTAVVAAVAGAAGQDETDQLVAIVRTERSFGDVAAADLHVREGDRRHRHRDRVVAERGVERGGEYVPADAGERADLHPASLPESIPRAWSGLPAELHRGGEGAALVGVEPDPRP